MKYRFLHCLVSVFAFTTLSAAPESTPTGFNTADLPRLLSQEALQISPSIRDFTLQLPSGETLSFDDIDIRVNAGVKSIRSKQGNTELLLTTDGRRGFGYVLHDGKHYVIDTVNGVATIVRSDSLPPPKLAGGGLGDDVVINDELILELAQRYADGEEVAAASAVPSVVDVAFFYDQAIADAEGLQSPQTRAQAAIDYTNVAIANHNSMLELRLVYVGPLSVPLTGDPFFTFATNSDKTTTANNFGADLMHYMYYYGGETYCGKANLPGRTGVSATGSGCDLNFVASHEMGHNLGLHHDRANASNIGLPYSGYNYGYICGNFGTIMAYWSPRVPHYSTPLLQNGGEDCGIDIGLPNAAFNGAVFEETRVNTAAFVADQTIVGNVWIDTAGPIQVDETTGASILVTVMRDGDLDQPTSVEIGAIETSATSGRDFVDFVERLEFGVGESTKQISVGILDDGAYEPVPETFDVVVRYPLQLAVTGSPLTIEILSDDPNRGIATFPAQYSAIYENYGTLQIPVNRAGPTDLELTVDVEIIAPTAQAGVDYTDVSGPLTFAVGESAKTIDVPIIDDALFEGQTYVQLNVYLTGDNIDDANSIHSVFIFNDDFNRGQGRFPSDTFYVTENAGYITIPVERINGAEIDYTYCVQYYMDGTAIAGVDYEGGMSLCSSMPDGVTTGSVSSSIYDNGAADGEKFFDVDFYPYSNDTAEPTIARVIIIDDDAPNPSGGSIQFNTSQYAVDETAGFVDVAISRVGGSVGAAYAQYTTVQGSATSGFDYTPVSGEFYWADGDAADKVVRIPIIDDPDVEYIENFSLSLSNIYGAAPGAAVTASVSVASDEAGVPPAPGVEFDAATFNDRISNPMVIDFEGYADPGNFIYLGDPGQFVEGGVTIDSNSPMFLQNNDYYGTGAYLSPQQSNPEIVDITLPPNTLAVGFYYQSAAATIELDGGQTFDLPAVSPGSFGFFGVAREDAIQTLQIVVGGPGIDIDNLAFSSSFELSLLPQLFALPDINGDTFGDLVVLREGSVLAEVRDGVTGTLLKNITFLSDAYTPITAAALPDADGNGIAELAVLATRNSDGRVLVEMRNLTGPQAPRQIFFAAGHTALAMAVVEGDADDDGVPEIAVLLKRNSDGRGRAEVKNAFGPKNTQVIWAANGYDVMDVEVVDDADNNGVPEIAIMSMRDSDNRIVVQTKNAVGLPNPKSIFFMAGNTAIDLVAVGDKEANGVAEIAVLSSRDSDGRNVVEVKNADGPKLPTTLWFSAGYTALGAEAVADGDGNSVPEVAVLATRDSDGRVLVEVKNAAGAVQPKQVFYSPGYTARNFAIVDDADNNGVPEAAVLMVRDSDGRILVQGRNTSGPASPRNFFFTP